MQDPECKETAERQMRIAASLRDTLAVLNSNRTLDEILDYIVDQARDLLRADGVAIYVRRENESLLQIQSSLGLDPDYIAEASIPLGKFATGYATLTGQSASITHIDEFPEKATVPIDHERSHLIKKLSEQFKALLAVPLVFPQGEVYGTLDLYFKSPREFSDEEVSLARAYADQTILAIENARLREQAERAAVLSERNRLARDLHDTVTQTLFSASLIAEVLPDLWQQDEENGRVALEEMRLLSKGALAEMRTLLFELRPSALLNVELGQLICQLAEAFSGRARVPVHCDLAALEKAVSDDEKIAIYRIAQEALHNIEKHARCQSVRICLGVEAHADARRSVLRIEDDGRGFAPEAVPAGHMGLRIMRERAEHIGAVFNVESSPGEGTKITLFW